MTDRVSLNDVFMNREEDLINELNGSVVVTDVTWTAKFEGYIRDENDNLKEYLTMDFDRSTFGEAKQALLDEIAGLGLEVTL